MSGAGLDDRRLARLQDVMADHVASGDVPGLVWAVARHGEAHVGAAGGLAEGRTGDLSEATIFRISSMTKPVTAVAALILVEECRLRLDDPIDPFLPELADRRVLARPGAALDDTVPAERPITVRDLLTFRSGHGMDFGATVPQPTLAAGAALELGAGMPAPALPPAPDEWMRRLGTLPLERQPGTQWLYHTSAEILGVLIARCAGRPFEDFLRERILEPLGMTDTGFSVPAGDLDRFGPCYTADVTTGARQVYDLPDGQWSTPPAFPSGAAGLVSTARDFLAFGEMLRAGGTYAGQRILSRPTVMAMTTNQLDPDQPGPDPSGATGWGFGVGIQLWRTGPMPSPGSYGWDGGLGSSWGNDPCEDLVAILLTNQAWTSPARPAVTRDFWTCAYAAIDD